MWCLQQESMFFFEKKNKKLLVVWTRGACRNWPRVPRSKSFLLLFFKKEGLP
jgi:hypothetical protein